MSAVLDKTVIPYSGNVYTADLVEACKLRRPDDFVMTTLTPEEIIENMDAIQTGPWILVYAQTNPEQCTTVQYKCKGIHFFFSYSPTGVTRGS